MFISFKTFIILQPKKSAKYLSVIIDSSMSLNLHIKPIFENASFTLFLFNAMTFSYKITMIYVLDNSFFIFFILEVVFRTLIS